MDLLASNMESDQRESDEAHNELVLGYLTRQLLCPSKIPKAVKKKLTYPTPYSALQRSDDVKQLYSTDLDITAALSHRDFVYLPQYPPYDGGSDAFCCCGQEESPLMTFYKNVLVFCHKPMYGYKWPGVPDQLSSWEYSEFHDDVLALDTFVGHSDLAFLIDQIAYSYFLKRAKAPIIQSIYHGHNGDFYFSNAHGQFTLQSRLLSDTFHLSYAKSPEDMALRNEYAYTLDMPLGALVLREHRIEY